MPGAYICVYVFAQTVFGLLGNATSRVTILTKVQYQQALQRPKEPFSMMKGTESDTTKLIGLVERQERGDIQVTDSNNVAHSVCQFCPGGRCTWYGIAP